MSALSTTMAALFALGLASSCGGPTAAKEKQKPVKEEKPQRGRIKEKDAVSEKGKSWGGWRWKGRNDECYYVFENRCFAKLKGACKAAGCDKDSCEADDGAPAKVSCKK